MGIPLCRIRRLLPRLRWRRVLVVGVFTLTFSGGVAAADVRVIVDVSASMGQTDPDNLRSDAVGLLLRMLPNDGQAGVWTYGQYVNMLVKYGTSDGLWKETAAIRTSNLDSVGLRSNLLEAVERASWDRHDRQGEPAHIVLLTDGRLDVSDDAAVNAAEKRRLLGDLAPELAAAGFTVHTLALSGQADFDLLRSLAAATGGYHGRIGSPEALPGGLVALLGWVASTATVALGEQGMFRISPGTRELTVLRLGDPANERMTLVGPDGERFERETPQTRVRWHVGRAYELVTLERPAAGLWRVPGAAGVEIYTYGDLDVVYRDLPGIVFPGDLRSFEFTLHSGGEPVTDPDFLKLLEVSARLQGTGGDVPVVVEPTESGRYRVNLLGLHDRGDYVLQTRLWGPTFSHTLSLPFAVDNPLNVEVHPAVDGFVLWAQLGAAALDHDSLRMAALVRRPPAPAKLFPLERLPTGMWKLTVPGARGLVEVGLDMKGSYLNQKDFDLRTKPIRVVLPVAEVQYVNLDLQGRPILEKSPPEERLPNGLPGRPSALPARAPEHDAVPVAVRPVSEEEDMPGWLAAVVGVMNLLLGAGVWWLLARLRPPSDRPEDLSRLRQLMGLEGFEGESEAVPAGA